MTASSPPEALLELARQIDRLLERMVEQQRTKTLEIARRIIPGLTPEDVMVPEAYPILYGDGPFNYEDGIVNGLISAQMAIRAELRPALDGSRE